MDDLIWVDLPLCDTIAVVIVDMDSLRKDHLDIAIDVMDYRELVRGWEGFFEGFAHELGLLLPALVFAHDLD